VIDKSEIDGLNLIGTWQYRLNESTRYFPVKGVSAYN
jgi:hypothetical protein